MAIDFPYGCGGFLCRRMQPWEKAVENGIEIGSEETAEETLDEELPPVAQEEPEDEVKKINFEHGFENGEEYAVITGVNQLGETVWEYKTGRYPGTELDRICEIGIQGDWYYFVEDRAVVVLDRWDGTVVWKTESTEVPCPPMCSARTRPFICAAPMARPLWPSAKMGKHCAE